MQFRREWSTELRLQPIDIRALSSNVNWVFNKTWTLALYASNEDDVDHTFGMRHALRHAVG